MKWDKNRKTHIVRWLRRRTLVYFVKNSVGSRAWAKSFILDSDNRVHDLYESGNLSCAYFISSVLKTCELWDGQCVGNVNSLISKLPDNGWERIEEPRIGAIVIYGEVQLDRAWATRHVGFVVGEDEVVSNGSSNSFAIESHPINYMKVEATGEWRSVDGYWWHKDFEDDELFEQEESKFKRRETPEHKL